MRKWCGLFLSGALAIVLAVPSSAEPKPFSATFALELGSFPPFTATATGNLDATIEGGQVTAFTLPANTFDLEVLTVLPDKIDIGGGIFLVSVKVEAVNQKGDFVHEGGTSNGSGVGTVDGASTLNLTAGGNPLPPALIPLTGAIGTTDTVKTKLLGAVDVTLAAKKWTLGKATLVSIPLDGSGQKNVTKTGAFEVKGESNVFTYIAPTQITIATDPQSLIASFGRLTVEIQEVPEAGKVLLLATGAAVLIALGMRRRATA